MIIALKLNLRSHGMKSYFSTLLLANYEQQMYGETPANYTSFSLGDLRSKMNQTSKNKLREPNSVKKNSSFMNEQTNVNNMSEDDKDTNSENEMPVNSLYERNCKEIYLNVEPLVSHSQSTFIFSFNYVSYFRLTSYMKKFYIMY